VNDDRSAATTGQNSTAFFLKGRPVGQVGIVVRDLEGALERYTRLWGVGRWACYTYGTHVLTRTTVRGRTDPYAMRLAMNSAYPQVELIESTLGPNLYEECLLRPTVGAGRLRRGDRAPIRPQAARWGGRVRG